MEHGRSVLSIKRIQKELSEMLIDPPAFCRPGASPVTDPYHFEVVIDGPAGSPYAGGTFPLDVMIPKDYPFKPPQAHLQNQGTYVRTYVPTSRSSFVFQKEIDRSTDRRLITSHRDFFFLSFVPGCRCTTRTSTRRGRSSWTSSRNNGARR